MLNVPDASPASRLPRIAPGIDTNGVLTLDRHARPTVLLTEGDWLIGRGAGRVRSVLHGGLAVVLWARQQQLGAVVVCEASALEADMQCPGPDAHTGVTESVRWLASRLVDAGGDLAGAELSLLGAAGADPELVGRIASWAHLWAASQQLGQVRHELGGQASRGIQFNLFDGHLTVVRNGLVSPARSFGQAEGLTPGRPTPSPR
jgi:hypothetical protein